MSNRFESQTAPAGFGLVGWLEQTKVCLPLKGVECRFAVCGDLLDVQIDQVFQQNSTRALDCLYTFPLPAGAAVYRCEMHVNGRVIRAKVEEQERAREIVREKKAAGFRTALVEMERENLFTLSLGNVQPSDVVVVRFAYFQTLTRLQDWTSFRIPFCPGVRYIPGRPLLRSPSGRGVADDTDQVPDASRISPPRMSALDADAAYLCVEGKLEDLSGNIRDVSSPTHPVLVRDGERSFAVRVAEDGVVPDRDFVLRWTEVAGEEPVPAGWLLPGEKDNYALVRLQAPPAAPSEAVATQDIYFLLDRSGSMDGLKWQRAAQAFREFVGTLGVKDRVWLTLFESQFQDFAERPLSAAQVLGDRAARELEKLGTARGTELLPALVHVLEKMEKHSKNRPLCLLIITDGQVGNEAEILSLLRRRPPVRVHTFGIDTAVNDAFLKQLAAQQGGTCHLVTPQDDIVGTVARLGYRLRGPVLTSIQVADGWEVPGGGFPDLHAGETVCVALRGPATAQQVSLRGCRPDGTVYSSACVLAPRRVAALRLLWVREKIQDCLSRGQTQEAIGLAKANNLVCPGAAFVAWDEGERVAISQVEVYQPAMEMHRVSRYLLGSGSHELGWGRMGAKAYCGSARRARMLDGGAADAMVRYSSYRTDLHGPESTVFMSEMGCCGMVIDWEKYKTKTVVGLAEALKSVQGRQQGLVPLTVEVFLILCEWVLSEVGEANRRFARLRKLVKILAKKRDQEAERGRLLRAWMEQHLEPASSFYRRVRALLEAQSSAVKHSG